MFDALAKLLSDPGLLPHGYCLAWAPTLLWTLVVGNALIGLAYFSIPLTLLYFVRQHPELKFNWVFMMFSLFIFACGMTHFISIVSIWLPVYRVDATMMALAAAVSVITAVAIWPLAPKASAFLKERAKSQLDLQEANRRLSISLALLEQRQHQAVESEKRFRLTVENAPIGLAIVSLEGRFTEVNQALCSMLGYDEVELRAKTFQEITHPEDLAEDLGHVQDLIDGRRNSYRMDKRYFHRDGHVIHIQLDVSMLRDDRGAPVHFIAQIQDVSHTRLLTDRLSHQVLHDGLTGLPNRLAFEETLTGCVADAHDHGGRYLLLYLDIDHFKAVNDTRGHATGDRLLRELSALLRLRLRQDDYLARLGGDEFAVILRHTTDDAGRAVADSLIRAVSSYRLDHGKRPLKVGLSVGIAAISAGNCDPSLVLAQADTACYAAKDHGRGRYHFYRHDDAEILLAERTLDWAHHIQSAIDDNRFEVYLQQIIGSDRTLLGYETLIRMRGESGEIILPNAFLPAALRMGWMTRIDQWMFREVLALARKQEIDSSTGRRPYLSLNLSASSVGDAAFVDWMLPLLDDSGIDSQVLRFEITEAEKLQANDTELRLVNELCRRGYRVWLDDFGTGYNSFDLLKRMPVHGIKIDRSFVHDLLRDPIDRALTAAIISIGKAMNLEIVAEGVEDEETCRALLDMGAHSFQGHLFHQAQAVDVALARGRRPFPVVPVTP